MDFKKADCIRGWDIKNAHTKRVNRRIMMITLDSQLFSVVLSIGESDWYWHANMGNRRMGNIHIGASLITHVANDR